MIQPQDLLQRRSDEKIILFLRRHKVVWWRQVVIFTIIFLLPVGFWLMLNNQRSFLIGWRSLVQVLILFTFIYYLFLWMLFYRSFLDYYLDVWVVTNYRIINIEHEGLFHRVVAEHDLEKIQDVAAEQQGFLATFFNYGDVYIQTAGEQVRFQFEQVPDPQTCAHQINKLRATKARI